MCANFGYRLNCKQWTVEQSYYEVALDSYTCKGVLFYCNNDSCTSDKATTRLLWTFQTIIKWITSVKLFCTLMCYHVKQSYYKAALDIYYSRAKRTRKHLKFADRLDQTIMHTNSIRRRQLRISMVLTTTAPQVFDGMIWYCLLHSSV